MAGTDPKGCASPRSMPLPVEPLGDFLDPQGSGLPVTFQIQSKNKTNEFSLDGIHIQTLLDFRATPFRLDDAIAKRGRRAVPKALLGGLAHGSGDVLTVLPRIVFIKDADDLPHQLLGRIIASWLSHRDHLDAALAQLSDGQLHLCAISIETRECVHANHIKTSIGAPGPVPACVGTPVACRPSPTRPVRQTPP